MTNTIFLSIRWRNYNGWWLEIRTNKIWKKLLNTILWESTVGQAYTKATKGKNKKHRAFSPLCPIDAIGTGGPSFSPPIKRG
jgi:hypothetical protein